MRLVEEHPKSWARSSGGTGAPAEYFARSRPCASTSQMLAVCVLVCGAPTIREVRPCARGTPIALRSVDSANPLTYSTSCNRLAVTHRSVPRGSCAFWPMVRLPPPSAGRPAVYGRSVVRFGGTSETPMTAAGAPQAGQDRSTLGGRAPRSSGEVEATSSRCGRRPHPARARLTATEREPRGRGEREHIPTYLGDHVPADDSPTQARGTCQGRGMCPISWRLRPALGPRGR